MYGLMASLVVQISLAWLLSQDPESRMAVKGLLASLMGTILILAWRQLCVLRAWLATCLEKEPVAPEDSWVDLCGPPRFDPTKGVYGEVLIDGKCHRVVIQPDFWPLLRSAVNIDRNEAAVANSIVSPVKPGKEPGSLVCIQAKDGKMLGMGARVHCGPATVLLTAAHVLKQGKIADLYLSKYSASSGEGKRVLMDPTWAIEYGSLSKETDIVAVQVPASVWSRLGVTTSRVRKPTVKVPVLAFGGQSSGVLTSSQGFATPEGVMSVAHSCTTQPGWSGTPLYAGSDIVGIHRRWDKIGSQNMATNVSIFHTNCESSENGEQGAQEIDDEEWTNREGSPTDVYVAGRGRFKTMGDEYSRHDEHPLAFAKYKKEKGEMTWAEMVEDDLEWDIRNETSMVPLNLPAGGERVLIAVREMSGIEWSSGEILTTEGMPLIDCGRSRVHFREVARTGTNQLCRDAEQHFSDLSDLSWPERGSKAERISLLFQASRFRPTKAPANLESACRELEREYPKSVQRICLWGETWNPASLKAKIQEIAQRDIKRDSSPGVPLSLIATTNGAVLDSSMTLVVEAVWARLEALSRIELSPDVTPSELIQLGLCDPVRLFIKQEPHPLRKVRTGRLRLISSVSLIDQLVERVLFGFQNNLEISQWKQCPSKPGMGLTAKEQSDALWGELKFKSTLAPAAEADISGFDWSVQHWELEAEVEMRIRLGNFGVLAAKAARNRFVCLSNSVFQLSDGTLIAQGLPGLMKSGSYCTSSSNSRIRCLMAKIIGSRWCIAMGDDSVEGWVDNAVEKYHALGHECKEYSACAREFVDGVQTLKTVNFCSHELSEGSCHLTTWSKTLFRYFHSTAPCIRSLEMELAGSPQWPKIHRYLRRVGLAPDKDGKKEGQPAASPSSRYSKGEIQEEEEERKAAKPSHQKSDSGFNSRGRVFPDRVFGATNHYIW
nr:MAG: polyprotein P2ab [Sobemovirus sp.]